MKLQLIRLRTLGIAAASADHQTWAVSLAKCWLYNYTYYIVYTFTDNV
jgi:hypothetical protein